MISIVICHRNKDYLQKITANIQKTIGIPFELVVIDNSTNQHSIFEAYNIGVSKSSYPIICFTHEDILFHTENWGQKVIEHFIDQSIGMIGIIGGNIFPKSPAPWWSNIMLNDHLINVLQHWQRNVSHQSYQTMISENAGETITHQFNNPSGLNVVDAVVLDGLWFCIRKELFDKYSVKFDSETFHSFHSYDSDISLQVKEHARVCVVFDILTEHFQQGTFNRDWFESTLALSRKWRNKLPIFAKPVDMSKYPLYEWETLRTFIYWADAAGYAETDLKKIILEIYPILPKDKSCKTIFVELVTRAKYGKNISRVINRLYKLVH